MSTNRVPSIPLTDFYRLRTQFDQAVRDRKEERQNHSDDTPYNFALLEEMVMSVFAELASMRASISQMQSLLGVTEDKE